MAAVVGQWAAADFAYRMSGWAFWGWAVVSFVKWCQIFGHITEGHQIAASWTYNLAIRQKEGTKQAKAKLRANAKSSWILLSV